MKYDIVIWGATSFVGKLVVEYLANTYKDRYSIALAGRNKQKLEEVNNQYCQGEWPCFIGDAHDQNFLNDLACSTKLVISTVGPYALYGEPLIKACVERGIDYCDLTGEPQWIWQMLQSYEAKAKETGARIMHCCGFDSIPSDLGVYHLQQVANQQFGGYCNQIHYRFKASKGGFSGGTVASMLNAIKQITNDKSKARILKTPYALVSDKPDNLPYQKAVKGLEKDPNSGHYLAPFIMASINTKVVHRTNFLLGYPWQAEFLYDEAMQLGRGFKGWSKGFSLVTGLSVFALSASFSFTRSLLERYLVPKPGEGPSEELVKNGFFKVELIGRTSKQEEVKIQVTGQGDPGYGSTCKMISETACLLLATSKEQTGVGFLTPAAALGSSLVDRLEQNANLNFKSL